MIIWKGMGIVIPVITIFFLWLTGLLFEEDLKTSSLHYGIGLIVAGLFLLLTIKKSKWNDKKYLNSDDKEKAEKYRKAKEAVEANPFMDINKASLFFIPFVYWPYILWAGGLTALISHFIG